MTTPTITLSGIQPTGELHLGNYAGAVRPLARLAAQPARETYVFVADEVRGRYRTGGIGYGEVKARLAEQLQTTLAPMRDRYHALLADPAWLDAALRAGERNANRRAAETVRLMSSAMGL
jgi:tryptophanyl-tRNA synthetase